MREQIDRNTHQCCDCCCLILASGVSTISCDCAVNRLSSFCYTVGCNRLISENLNSNVACLFHNVLGLSCLRKHVNNCVSVADVELSCIVHLVVATVLQVEDQSIQDVNNVIDAVLETTRDDQRRIISHSTSNCSCSNESKVIFNAICRIVETICSCIVIIITARDATATASSKSTTASSGLLEGIKPKLVADREN